MIKIIKHTSIKALILSALFVCLNFYSFSQGNQIELVHADKVTNAIIFPNAVKLIGHVEFKHDSRKLFCDSAFFHKTENWVKAYGNVQINQADTLNLFCDSLFFNGKTNIGILRSNVRFRDNEFKMTTDSLEFDANQSMGYYRNWATINAINQDLSIVSKKGYYYSTTKTFYFKDSINVKHPNYTLKSDTLEFNTNTETVFFHGPTIIEMDSTIVHCKKGYYNTKIDFLNLYNGATIFDKATTLYADSLIYDRTLDKAEGFYNVSILDTIENITLKSEYLIKSENNSKIKMTDNARIYQYTNNDTLFIQADTIFQNKDTLLNSSENVAINNVRLINKGIIAICDSLYFNEQDSIIKLRKSPFVWQDSTQLSADSMNVFLTKSQIDNIKLYDKAFVVTQKDTIHYDQLSGKYIEANFKNDEIQQIFIDGNSETLYYPTNSKTDSLGNEVITLQGQNKLISEQILVFFEKSEIVKIKFIDQPDAQFFPLNQIKEDELYLKKFIWNFNQKPSSVIPK